MEFVDFVGTVTDVVTDGCEQLSVQLDGRNWHAIAVCSPLEVRHIIDTVTGCEVKVTYRRLEPEPLYQGVSRRVLAPTGTITLVPSTNDEVMEALNRGVAAGEWTVFAAAEV